MKKYTLILAALLLLTMPTKAERVDAKTAQKVAETFIQAQTGTKVALHQIEYVDKAEFSHFYVFGTEDSFVIISADDCVQPVLGYSTENPFGTEKMPENLFWWLKGYDEQIADAAKSGQKATNDVAKEWKELASGNTSKAKSEVIVEPLIQTKWNQDSPYNNLCPPNGSPKLTGCVATAMAQIMKYWEYPTTGFGSHSYTPATHPEYGEQFVNFGETTYDWNNMINTYSSSSTDVQKIAVATLMYHCGVSVDMKYGEVGDQSGTQPQYVVGALTTYFNYNQTARYITRESIVDEDGHEDIEQWETMLIAELTADPPRPILYGGRRQIDETHTTGHAFICDGYEIDANNKNKFNLNWGWGGSSNGSFDITQMNYPLSQAAIFGIQPITFDAQPSGLTASVSNQNVILTWETVDNASSYNVYRDYVLIGNTGTNASTFTDNNVPIGDYIYFVRSVDGQGNVSLPSNIVNAAVEFICTLENLMVEHLEISYHDGNATLQWAAPYRLNYLDFYRQGNPRYYTGSGNTEPFYWGSRFLASILDEGSSLTSVSTFFYTSGEYTVYVYQCTGGVPSGQPIRQISGTYPEGWTTIAIDSLVIDHTKDLWIIFKSTNIIWPTVVGLLGTEEGNYYSLNGSNWYHFNTGYSFFITAGLTNSNFTFNLYDNGACILDNLNTNTHTMTDISGAAHQYTVKSKLGNEESQASNMAGVTVGTASLESLELGDNDNMTIAENSTLTVESLINGNPDNLIIENGGQLITSSEDVQATMKKNIEAATHWGDANYTADGWYFIASPIVSTPDYEISGMTTSDETVGENTVHTFDLYRYNESAELEWENYREHHSEQTPFTIDNGAGYLYASKNGTTIRFQGVIKPYSPTSNQVTLTQNGWNLIGNPFTCAVTVNHAFAELSNGSSVTYKEANSTINPCAGIAVYGNTNEKVTFSMVEPQSPTQTNSLNLILTQQVLSRDGTSSTLDTLDNAIVSFNEGSQLKKFYFMEQDANLYIPWDEKEYAIVSVGNVDELPVNFKAAKNGTYTLTVSGTLNSKLSTLNYKYLHLIDNMTGANIDLLETTSYTFEAKTSDYPSRFKLVFSNCEDAVGDNGNFAYVSNGEIIVADANDDAILQVVDMLGHVILTHKVAPNSSLTTPNSPGVYMLRLITAEGVKTQKMIIE